MLSDNIAAILRYMGTITGITDLDPVRWPTSYWRSVKVCQVYLVPFYVEVIFFRDSIDV